MGAQRCGMSLMTRGESPKKLGGAFHCNPTSASCQEVTQADRPTEQPSTPSSPSSTGRPTVSVVLKCAIGKMCGISGDLKSVFAIDTEFTTHLMAVEQALLQHT